MPTLTHGAWLVWILSLPGIAKAPAPKVDLLHVDFTHEVEHQAQAPAQPQPVTRVEDTGGREFFFSWGYNGDSYSNSDIHFSQPSLGNDFTLVDVNIRDSKTWTDLFNHSLFVPQYNVRLGVFFNEKWGLEVALDHMKWIVREDQQVRLTGTLHGSDVDTHITLTEDVLRYQLNNGANPIFFNLMRRFRLSGTRGRTGYFSLLAKAGGGFAVPHTENTLFGYPNDKGFQPFIGWNLDAGVAGRIHFYRWLYFEAEQKFVYARYSGVKVDRGTARHSVRASEFIFNFGVSVR